MINSSRNLKNRVGETLQMAKGPSSVGSEVKMKVLKDPECHTLPWFGSTETYRKDTERWRPLNHQNVLSPKLCPNYQGETAQIATILRTCL